MKIMMISATVSTSCLSPFNRLKSRHEELTVLIYDDNECCTRYYSSTQMTDGATCIGLNNITENAMKETGIRNGKFADHSRLPSKW